MQKLPQPLLGVLALLAGLLVGLDASAQAPKKEPKLADYFGFQPLEIYKLEYRIGNLMLKDLDGDKVDDIVVSNNGRSRIDLLLSTKKPDDDQANRPFRKDPNELQYDRRMRLVSIPVNKEVVSVDTGDFNGDGKPDMVYYGTPAEVEILFNEGQGRFGNAKKIATGDATDRPSALTVGDLDQDGRDDIALLAEHELVFVYQTATGTLTEPGAGAAHRREALAAPGAGRRRRRRQGPGPPRQRRRPPRPHPVRHSGEEAGPRAAVRPGDPPRGRFRQDGRSPRHGDPHDREPVGPGAGAHARPLRHRRGEQARPPGVLRAAVWQRARPVAGPGRPGRRRPPGRGDQRPRPTPRCGPISSRASRAWAPARPSPAWSGADGPPRRPGRRPQG